jgi:hypothetical protein
MRRLAIRLAAIAVTIAICLVIILAGEGVYSVLRWRNSDQGILYKGYAHLGRAVLSWSANETAVPDFARMAGRAEFDEVLPALRSARAGLGNTDYRGLPTDRVNKKDEDGCLVQEPDRQKVMAFIRSNLFEPLDPPLLFVNEGAMNDEIEEFIDAYGWPPFHFSTNSRGERTTLPLVSTTKKVLIAGDSVANGAGVSDGDTLASQLQALDLDRQYVNLGVSSARGAHVICVLERALKRYAGEVDELIYIYCSNDFDQTKPYGTPEEVIGRLVSLTENERISKVTIVYAPFVYNIVPQLTRFKGYRGEWFPDRSIPALRLKNLTEQAGFRYIAISNLAMEEIALRGSQFGVFSLFVDHVHLSPYGIARLADRLRND